MSIREEPEQNQISTKTETQHSSAPSPEPQGSSSTGLKWSEVLGSAASPAERKIRERGRKAEAEVSSEVLQLARQNLVEAALVYGKGFDPQNNDLTNQRVGNLQGFADVLKQINSNLDFSNPQQVEAAVSKLFEQHGAQAVALAVAYQELKYQAMLVVYNINLTSVSEVEQGKPPSTLPTSNEIIINPDGTVTFQSKTISYEEFIKTPDGQRRGLFGIRHHISKKEFQKILQGEPGKEGRYKINISRLTTSTSITTDQLFLLEQLDFYSQSQLFLDPNNSEDFRYLLEEYQRTVLMRAEIARATGVPVSDMSKIFEGGLLQTTLSGLKIENLSTQVKNAIDEERKRIAEETKQRLKQTSEEHRLQVTRAQLEQRVSQLEKELEEVRRRERKISGESTISFDQISQSLEKEFASLVLELGLEQGEIKVDGIFEQLKKLTKDRDNAVLDFDMAGGDTYLQSLRDLYLELQRSLTQVKRITYKNGDVENIGSVEDIKERIEETKNEIESLKQLMKTREKNKNKLKSYESWLQKQIAINGESKTIQQWVEAYILLKPDEGGEGVNRPVEEIEQDLSSARVLLGYFNEGEQTRRNAILAQVGDVSNIPDISFDDVEALNPRLAKVLEKVNDQQKQSFLKILQIIFGQELILPASRDDQRVVDLVNFLNVYIDDLKDKSDYNSFNDTMKEICRLYISLKIK